MHHTNKTGDIFYALFWGEIKYDEIIDGWALVPVVDEVRAGQLELFK